MEWQWLLRSVGIFNCQALCLCLTLQKIIFPHKKKNWGSWGMMRWMVYGFMLLSFHTWCWDSSFKRWIDTQISCDDIGRDYSQAYLLKAMCMPCSLTSYCFCLLILRKSVTSISISNIFSIRESKYSHICMFYGADSWVSLTLQNYRVLLISVEQDWGTKEQIFLLVNCLLEKHFWTLKLHYIDLLIYWFTFH